MALEVLIDSGCKPINIMFLNLICAPEGLEALRNNYPEVIIRDEYIKYLQIQEYCLKNLFWTTSTKMIEYVYLRYML